MMAQGGERAAPDPLTFVAANTVARSPPLVPELSLRVADDALPLWQLTEAELERTGLPPPFWAFAWAGGQALARFVLDHPAIVSGKVVLDLGAGGGIAGIAAAKAGASHVKANEVDAFALAAIALNAKDNRVAVEAVPGDLMDGAAGADVVLAADVFYERALAERAFQFLSRAAMDGAQILIGDPKRSYLPADRLTPVATYDVAVTRALEDADVKRTTVWRLA